MSEHGTGPRSAASGVAARPRPRFEALLENDIWTVFQGDMPIGRAVSKKDADDFVAALNGLIAHDLRDRILQAVGDAVEECFDG